MVRGYSDGHIDGVRGGRHRGFEQGCHAGVQEEELLERKMGEPSNDREHCKTSTGLQRRAASMSLRIVCLSSTKSGSSLRTGSLSIEYQQKEELSCVKAVIKDRKKRCLH